MRWLRAVWVSCLLSGFLLAAVGAGAADGAGQRRVSTLRATGMVNPPLAGYIVRGIAQANRSGAEALIVQLDTPGGLDTSMREIIQATLDSDVPVVVYVSPPGGRAASAGLFIATAAHVAAMAPNTNIGSAHPVSMGSPTGGEGAAPDQTMTEKVTNDAVAYIQGLAATRGRNVDWAERAVRESVNVTADEAVRLKVVDLVADDLPDLLNKLEGRSVKLPHETRALRTAGAAVEEIEMGFIERFLQLVSDPNIAYILLSVGVYGLIYELASPGSVLPGAAGVFALVLAFYSLGTLPINYAGLVLILFGFVLFAAEILIAPGVGGLALAGAISLLAGSVLLLNGAPSYMSLSWWVIAGVVLVTTLFFAVLLRAIVRTHRSRPTTGLSALSGSCGFARTDIGVGSEQTALGAVMVGGELWRARSIDSPISAGSSVEVVSVDGFTLNVRRT